MRRRWRQGDQERRRHPRDVSEQMEMLAQEVVELAMDLRQIAEAIRQEALRGR
jgi:hypothetical protein